MNYELKSTIKRTLKSNSKLKLIKDNIMLDVTFLDQIKPVLNKYNICIDNLEMECFGNDFYTIKVDANNYIDIVLATNILNVVSETKNKIIYRILQVRNYRINIVSYKRDTYGVKKNVGELIYKNNEENWYNSSFIGENKYINIE